MAVGCTPRQSRDRSQNSDTAEPKPLVLPAIPIYITDQQAATEFMALNYWNNFDFADPVITEQEEREQYFALWERMTEQTFVDYFYGIFPHVPMQIVERSVATLLDKALDGSRQMFDHFADLFEKYLYDPNSPFRAEEFYIPVLRHIVGSERLDEMDKLRPRSLLEMALKNRPGEIATDFEYTLANGNRGRLHNVRAEGIVLFFNNPDCPDCMRVKGILEQLNLPGIRVVAIYPDDDLDRWRAAEFPAGWINGYNNTTLRTSSLYDLKAIPTLYLLDSEKRILLKDADVESVMNYLYQ